MESDKPLSAVERAGLENLIIAYINKDSQYNNGISQVEANKLAPNIREELRTELEVDQNVALAFMNHPEVLTIIAAQLTFPIRYRS